MLNTSLLGLQHERPTDKGVSVHDAGHDTGHGTGHDAGRTARHDIGPDAGHNPGHRMDTIQGMT